MNEMAMEGFRAETSETCGSSSVLAQPETSSVASFTAIVLAGARSPHDPVAARFDLPYKALVPIGGTPMISRVVATLQASPFIGKIVILFDDKAVLEAQCPEIFSGKDAEKVSVLSCGGSICDSVLQTIATTGHSWPYLLTTADHALLTPSMVEEFCTKSGQAAGFSVGLVEKAHIEREQPGSKRTYLPFRRGQYSGANLFALMGEDALAILRFWKQAEKNRKKPWKLFAAFGWLNLLGLLVRRFTVEQAFARGSKALGVNARPVKLETAEAAIDVDSLKDYEQVSGILAKRAENLQRFMAAE